MSYKLELHAHSKSVSACSSTPEEMVAQLYIDAGYDGIVLSNHYSSYTLHHFLKSESFEANVNTYIDAARKVREAAKGKLDVILGCEIHIADSSNDYLLFGFDEDFLYNEEILSYNIDKLSALCREKGILIFQAHPFRNGMRVVNPKLLDGIEVYNGHKSHDSRNTIADAWADRFGLRKSSGSDFHDPTSQIDGGILIGSRITTQKELKDVLLSSEYKLVKEYDLP